MSFSLVLFIPLNPEEPVKFQTVNEFPNKLEEFLDKLNSQYFDPRSYILDNLTLEKCSQNYLDILLSIQNSQT